MSPADPSSAIHPRLATPWSLRGRRLSNRVVLAPMSVCYGDEDGHVTDATVDHYARRASGGAGMVITENLAISVEGRQMPRQLLAADESYLPGLAKLASKIKSCGAVAVAQIVHSGRYAGPWDEYHARSRYAPSAVSFELRPGEIVTPAAMAEADIARTIADFAAAATLLREAGFDGVEIHGAQGFLVSAFQSPRMNLREDAYGEDRNLFARQVIDAVGAVAGDDLLLGYHLMSDEMMPGGWSVDDAVEFVRTLSSRVDFIVPIATTFESLRVKTAGGSMDATSFSPEVAARLAAVTSIPVVGNGGLGTEPAAESALASGFVQAIAIGRPMLCDPDLPNKILRRDSAAVLTCPCMPPRCLQTQLTGSICSSWPDAVQRLGHWGLEQAEVSAA